jgi:cobalt/nickel transport system permease protein
MIQEPFVVGDSILHTIDPRYRVMAAVLFSFVTALSYRLEALVCALLSAFLLVILAKLNFLLVMKRLSVLAGFLILIWLLLPLTYNGPAMMHIGPFDIVKAGVVLSLQITVKSVSILVAFMALVATMTITTLGRTMERLSVPDKIVHLILITYRYIFVIENEYLRLITAIKIRGFYPGTNLHTYRTYAYLIGMLFVRAFTRAKRVDQAMRCRGFQGKFYSLYQSAPSPYNFIFAISFLALITTLILLEGGFLVS